MRACVQLFTSFAAKGVNLLYIMRAWFLLSITNLIWDEMRKSSVPTLYLVFGFSSFPNGLHPHPKLEPEK